MASNTLQLIAACLVLALLSFSVGILVLLTRAREMRKKRIHPQAASTSAKMAARLENIQAADNFRNLFEVPVLFYALVAIAVAAGPIPGWLVMFSWLFVSLRVVHSAIHCTYNKVFHRLTAFMASFALLIGMWVVYFASLMAKSAA